uniref:Globoside alpha-1,3-N-acetylgalactosaminyltransferase 1 (FORS blood group) n=1 Tax=Ficedula albicollis TaxID=59894 RepID=U3JFK1_FICAL
MISRKVLVGSLLCLGSFPSPFPILKHFFALTGLELGVHHLPYYLPCPEIFSMKLQYTEEKLIQLFPQLFYQQPRVLVPKCQDVLAVTPWLAPIVWEGTFDPKILQTPEPHHRAFAVGKQGKHPVVPPCPLRAPHELCLCRYEVNCDTFTDSPGSIPPAQQQPGHRLLTVPTFSSWQEIPTRRTEPVSRHVAQLIHGEMHHLCCLDIGVVFHSPWGTRWQPQFLCSYPGYCTVPREQLPGERRSSSAALIPEGEGDFCYGGAASGGSVSKVCELTKTCRVADEANGIMAAWPGESHLNRHFLTHKPSKLLSPECIWDDRKPKPPEIRLVRFSTVGKNYKEIRN